MLLLTTSLLASGSNRTYAAVTSCCMSDLHYAQLECGMMSVSAHRSAPPERSPDSNNNNLRILRHEGLSYLLYVRNVPQQVEN